MADLTIESIWKQAYADGLRDGNESLEYFDSEEFWGIYGPRIDNVWKAWRQVFKEINIIGVTEDG